MRLSTPLRPTAAVGLLLVGCVAVGVLSWAEHGCGWSPPPLPEPYLYSTAGEPKAPVGDKRWRCIDATRALTGGCPGFDGTVERCVMEDSPDGRRGKVLHFGTKARWFVDRDGSVFTDGDAAAKLCPDLPTMHDRSEARGRKAAARARKAAERVR